MRSKGPWPRRSPAISFSGPERLPGRAEVVVIGGGLAGVAVTAYLAEAGVDVHLLEARQIGSGASGRHLGFARAGLVEHAYRLVHSLGEDGARELYQFGSESVDLLADRIPVRRGAWWIALDDREPDQLRQSAEVLARLGIAAEIRETELGLGLFTPRDALYQPHAAVTALGPLERIHERCRVHRVEVERKGCRVHLEEQQILAQMVVYAAGVGCRGLEEWFEDKITPVREQGLELRGVEVPLEAAWAGYGYTRFRRTPEGTLLVAGARWATPHMEVAEDDDTVLVDAIRDKLLAFGQRFGDAEIMDRWAWIFGSTCDGLPLLGPLPGRPELIACTGFVGNVGGLAMRAARAVSTGILTGRSPGVPKFMTTDRFL